MPYLFHFLPWCPRKYWWKKPCQCICPPSFQKRIQNSTENSSIQFPKTWIFSLILKFTQVCSLSNADKCTVCCDAPLEFFKLRWCLWTIIEIAVVPSWTMKDFQGKNCSAPWPTKFSPCHPLEILNFSDHTVCYLKYIVFQHKDCKQYIPVYVSMKMRHRTYVIFRV